MTLCHDCQMSNWIISADIFIHLRFTRSSLNIYRFIYEVREHGV